MRRAIVRRSRSLRADRGSVAVEHVLLIVVIALVAVTGMFTFGNAVLNKFDKPDACVATARLAACR